MRVSGRTPLGMRIGTLQYRIPAETIAVWSGLAQDGQLYLDVNDWARLDGLPHGRGDLPSHRRRRRDVWHLDLGGGCYRCSC